MKRHRTLAGLAVDLEADIDPDRADRRPVSPAEPDRGAKLTEVEIADVLEDVAAVDKPHDLRVAGHRHPKLAVEDDHGAAADR